MAPVTAQACSKCGEVKLLEMFSLHREGKHGRSKHCKVCKAKRGRERYAEPATKQRQIENQLARYANEQEAWIARSREYNKAHPHLAVISCGRRRARILAQFVEDIDPRRVYEIHGGMCGICKQYVAADEFEVDHVVPLARGGLHGYTNVQPAHRACNRRKWANAA